MHHRQPLKRFWRNILSLMGFEVRSLKQTFNIMGIENVGIKLARSVLMRDRNTAA